MIDDTNLLSDLIKDQENVNRLLYSSGPYWDYKNKKTILEIKQKGIKNFRGTSSGIGTSFSDNLILDVRNEYSTKGRIVGKFFSLPILNNIFNKQLSVTNNHIKSFIKNQEIVYKNNKKVNILINKFNFENTTEFGCLQSFIYQDKAYSCHYLNMADRIENLLESFEFKNIKSFFEIGGGFGANIHFLVTNFYNIKKIIYLDTVPNIYVGTQYLKYFFKEKVKNYTELKNLDKISFSNNDELEILCIPPWLIEKLDVEIDHFHNAASFVEMPETVVKNYAQFIQKFKTKEISLISYDGFNLETTFNPEDLNKFFHNKLNISWKKSLIEDYENKLIYLTSK